MIKKVEDLYNLFDVIITEKYNDTKEEFKTILKNSEENPQNVISQEIISEGFYGINDYSNSGFLTMVALDVLSEGFISVIGFNFDDNLWRRLNLLLIYNDAENLRSDLTYELYENKNINYTYENSGLIFKKFGFILFKLRFVDFQAIGLIKEEKYEKLEKICNKLRINIDN